MFTTLSLAGVLCLRQPAASRPCVGFAGVTCTSVWDVFRFCLNICYLCLDSILLDFGFGLHLVGLYSVWDGGVVA